MSKYYITSNSDIRNYSYEEGEMAFVNFYHRSAVIKANTPKQAVKAYIETELLYNVSDDDITYEDDRAYANVLVDEQNTQAQNHEIELWKKGLLKLYLEDISISVNHLEKVIF